ncbi:MAG TPA: 1,2-phenylacetyl-CoA epoxidase subunit PaaD, partial [Actinopolymorphaceae bacterium]
PDNTVEVDITPTYSGCPALETIRSDIRTALQREGFGEVRVRTVLAPTWTTDWITEAGRRKLAEFGIAPPSPRGSGPVALELSVRCPRCGSTDTAETSRFGSTACKAIWRCRSCLETFDRVKPL